MGDARPAFTRGESSGGFVIAVWSHNDAGVFIDAAFRAFRIQVVSDAFELTNIRPLAPLVATSLVRAALPPTP